MRPLKVNDSEAGGSPQLHPSFTHRTNSWKTHFHLLLSTLISCAYFNHNCPSGFPHVALRMMRMPIYLLVILAQVNQAALLAGLATFMAKFIERQFSQTGSLSSMMIGERSSPSSPFELGLTQTEWKLCPQVEFVSQWQYWAPSWEGLWCEGWTFPCAAPASCARAPSLSACSPPCRWCWLAAPPRRSMESFLLGNHTDGFPTNPEPVSPESPSCCSWEHWVISSNCPSPCCVFLLSSGSLSCSADCNCPQGAFNPVCGSNRVEFRSPCHAGCNGIDFGADNKPKVSISNLDTKLKGTGYQEGNSWEVWSELRYRSVSSSTESGDE